MSNVPRHISFILDGNRRWADEQGLPRFEGHRLGYENLLTISVAAFRAGCEFVSAYIFSTENWKRSKEEVGYLMNLVVKLAKNDIDRYVDENIKVIFMGSRSGVSKKVLDAIDEAEQRTAQNSAGTLVLCFNYGGHQEIADAITAAQPAKRVAVEDVEKMLYHPEVPAVDYMIRTSGEQRLSNFMLWRLAYAELYFVKKHWPSFNEGDLNIALAEYARRARRFGK